jgi:hypothetical protein
MYYMLTGICTTGGYIVGMTGDLIASIDYDFNPAGHIGVYGNNQGAGAWANRSTQTGYHVYCARGIFSATIGSSAGEPHSDWNTNGCEYVYR